MHAERRCPTIALGARFGAPPPSAPTTRDRRARRPPAAPVRPRAAPERGARVRRRAPARRGRADLEAGPRGRGVRGYPIPLGRPIPPGRPIPTGSRSTHASRYRGLHRIGREQRRREAKPRRSRSTIRSLPHSPRRRPRRRDGAHHPGPVASRSRPRPRIVIAPVLRLTILGRGLREVARLAA